MDHSAQLQDPIEAIVGQHRGATARAGGLEQEGATRQSSDSSLEEEEADVGAGKLESESNDARRANRRGWGPWGGG